MLMMLLPLVVSCGKESKEEAQEQTYAMLEQVAELSAGGNKQAALELADSALQMHPADSVRCWLMSEDGGAGGYGQDGRGCRGGA